MRGAIRSSRMARQRGGKASVSRLGSSENGASSAGLCCSIQFRRRHSMVGPVGTTLTMVQSETACKGRTPMLNYDHAGGLAQHYHQLRYPNVSWQHMTRSNALERGLSIGYLNAEGCESRLEPRSGSPIWSTELRAEMTNRRLPLEY